MPFYYSFIYHVVELADTQKRLINNPHHSDFLIISDATIEKLGKDVCSPTGNFYFQELLDLNRYETFCLTVWRRGKNSKNASSKTVLSTENGWERGRYDALVSEEGDPLLYKGNTMRGMKVYFHWSIVSPMRRSRSSSSTASSRPGVPPRRSVVRWATQSLDLGAPLLRFQAPFLGTATRPRPSSRR